MELTFKHFIEGLDGHVPVPHTRTARGKTNRPIAKLYPQTRSACNTEADHPVEMKEHIIQNENAHERPKERSVRAAAKYL